MQNTCIFTWSFLCLHKKKLQHQCVSELLLGVTSALGFESWLNLFYNSSETVVIRTQQSDPGLYCIALLPCRCGRLWSGRRRRCSPSARSPKLCRNGSSSLTRWKFSTTTSRNRAQSFSCTSPKMRWALHFINWLRRCRKRLTQNALPAFKLGLVVAAIC